MFVLEGPLTGEAIPVHRETVAAFVGPAPRGPVDIPVAVRSVDEYLQRFGSHDRGSRMELWLRQFFANGGSLAVVVRVCHSRRRSRLCLPGPAGNLVLEAQCPGPLEYLRASVDLDNLPAARPELFNLTVQRLDSVRRPLVVQQESFNAVSVRGDAPEFVGHALAGSELVRLVAAGELRPERTVGSGVAASPAYVYGVAGLEPSGAPDDYDLIGSPSDGTGLYALERIAALDLLCLVPPVPGRALGPVARFAAEQYCRQRRAVLVLDPPDAWTGPRDVVVAQRGGEWSSANAVSYFPLPGAGAAAGAVVGALAAADAGRGPWAMAGLDALPLRGLGRVAARVPSGDAALLLRRGVNVIVAAPGGGARLAGLVTLGRAAGLGPEWSGLARRRTALYVADMIARWTRWAAFRADAPDTLALVGAQLDGFLRGLWRDGALAGAHPGEAWYVGFPGDLDGFAIEVGVALHRGGDFAAFRFVQRKTGCRVQELGWQPELARAS